MSPGYDRGALRKIECLRCLLTALSVMTQGRADIGVGPALGLNAHTSRSRWVRSSSGCPPVGPATARHLLVRPVSARATRAARRVQAATSKPGAFSASLVSLPPASSTLVPRRSHPGLPCRAAPGSHVPTHKVLFAQRDPPYSAPRPPSRRATRRSREAIAGLESSASRDGGNNLVLLAGIPLCSVPAHGVHLGLVQHHRERRRDGSRPPRAGPATHHTTMVTIWSRPHARALKILSPCHPFPGRHHTGF